MMMEMPVNISGPTKVDVGGNDREESPTIGTVAPSSSKVVQEGPNRIGEDHEVSGCSICYLNNAKESIFFSSAGCYVFQSSKVMLKFELI